MLSQTSPEVMTLLEFMSPLSPQPGSLTLFVPYVNEPCYLQLTDIGRNILHCFLGKKSAVRITWPGNCVEKEQAGKFRYQGCLRQRGWQASYTSL